MIYIISTGYAVPYYIDPDFHNYAVMESSVYDFNRFRDQIHVTDDPVYADKLFRAMAKVSERVTIWESANISEMPQIHSALIRQRNELSLQGGFINGLICKRLQKAITLLEDAITEHILEVRAIQSRNAQGIAGPDTPMVWETGDYATIIRV